MKLEEKLQAAQKLYKTANADQKYVLETLFPELKESEDERIRKMLIKFFSHGVEYNSSTNGIYDKDIVAWLEKQGNPDINPSEFDLRLNKLLKQFETLPKEELANSLSFYLNVVQNDGTYKQKLSGKAKSEFNVGDWLVNNISKDVFLIKSINAGYYTLEDTKGNILSPCLPPLESESHLWSIKDAKAGDVLADKYNNIGIFQECDSICWHSYIYLGCDGELRGFSIGGSHEQTDTHPATKEQREQLEKAMADAGYTFDFDKKELKKIEQNPTDNDMKEALRTEYGKGRADAIAEMQKSAWSLDDVYMIKNICHAFEKGSLQYKWLKSLKDRVQPKVELTQLDKNILEAAIAFVEHNNHFNCWRGVDKHTVLSALHSLRPQNAWKPSDEQIVALRWVLNHIPYDSHKEEISGLLEQLKKLREE